MLLPQQAKIDLQQNIIVVECCTNCSTHAWNTRHDEAKYASNANAIAAQIQINHPNTVVLFNQVPKKWHEKEIYC